MRAHSANKLMHARIQHIKLIHARAHSAYNSCTRAYNAYNSCTCALRVEEEHEPADRGEDVEGVKVVVDSMQGGDGGDVVVHVILQVLLAEEAEALSVVETEREEEGARGAG